MNLLIEAIEQNNIAEIKKLIEIGADINAKDRTGRDAKEWAIWYGHAEIVNLLKAYTEKKYDNTSYTKSKRWLW